jgi:hypothetical protein
MRTKDRKASADVVLGTLEREARLFGLDAQRQDSYSLDQVVNLVRSIAALFQEVVDAADALERRQRFAAGLRRMVGNLTDIDAQAQSTTETERKPA